MSSKIVTTATVVSICALFAASPPVSAGPVNSCVLQKDTALQQFKLSNLNRLFGEVLTTESNGNMYFVSICRPIPNMFYDHRKLAGAVKFTTDGYSIDLGRIDRTDVVVNEDSIVLTYVGGDKDTNVKDACKGQRWNTYLTFICDLSATEDVLTLIDEDPDQPEICQVWFEIKTTKTCVRQPNVPLNILENDVIGQNKSIENGKNDETREETKANRIPAGDESFNDEIFTVNRNATNEESHSNRNISSEYVRQFAKYNYTNALDGNKSRDDLRSNGTYRKSTAGNGETDGNSRGTAKKSSETETGNGNKSANFGNGEVDGLSRNTTVVNSENPLNREKDHLPGTRSDDDVSSGNQRATTNFENAAAAQNKHNAIVVDEGNKSKNYEMHTADVSDATERRPRWSDGENGRFGTNKTRPEHETFTPTTVVNDTVNENESGKRNATGHGGDSYDDRNGKNETATRRDSNRNALPDNSSDSANATAVSEHRNGGAARGENRNTETEQRSKSENDSAKKSANNSRSSENRSETVDDEKMAVKNVTTSDANEISRSTTNNSTTFASHDGTTPKAVVQSPKNLSTNTTRRPSDEAYNSSSAATNSNSTEESRTNNGTAAVVNEHVVVVTTGRPVSKSDSEVPPTSTNSTGTATTPSSLNSADEDNNDSNGTGGAGSSSSSSSSSANIFSKLFPNGVQLSAATLFGGLGSLTALYALVGTAINRYYYKLTGTDQIPLKETFQSIYVSITKMFGCCAASDAVGPDENSALLRPELVSSKTSSDDENNRNGYGSVSSNEKRSSTAGKTYRKTKKKSKSDSADDNVTSSKLSKTVNDLQGKSVGVGLVQKLCAIVNEKVRAPLENIFRKTGKKFEDITDKIENVHETSNESSSAAADDKSVFVKDNGDVVRVDEKKEADITKIPSLTITVESEIQSSEAKPDENVKSEAQQQQQQHQDDPDGNSKKKLIDELIDDLNGIRFEALRDTESDKSVDFRGQGNETDEREIDAVAAAAAAAAAAVDEKPSDDAAVNKTLQNTVADDSQGVGIVRDDGIQNESVRSKTEAAKWKFFNSDEVKTQEQIGRVEKTEDGPIDTVEEIIYFDAEDGEHPEVQEIVEDVTATADRAEFNGSPSPREDVEKTSSTTPGEGTAAIATGALTPENGEKKPFGFQLGIGKSGLNMSVGAKQLGFGRSGVKFGKRVEQDGNGQTDAMTIKLDKSGLKLNRAKNKTPPPKTDEQRNGDEAVEKRVDNESESSTKNSNVFKRSVSQPADFGADVSAKAVSVKNPFRSSAGLLKFGKSRSKSTGMMETEDDFTTTDPNVMSAFIGHERYASSLSIDDVPVSEGSAAGQRDSASLSTSGEILSPDSAAFAGDESSPFDRRGAEPLGGGATDVPTSNSAKAIVKDGSLHRRANKSVEKKAKRNEHKKHAFKHF